MAKAVVDKAPRRSRVPAAKDLEEWTPHGSPENDVEAWVEVSDLILKLAKQSSDDRTGDGERDRSLEFMTAGELCRQTFATNHLVRNVIPANECGILAAPYKALKSHVGIDLVASLVTGTNFLGFEGFAIPKQVRAGYINCENGPQSTKDALERVLRSKHVDPQTVDGLFLSIPSFVPQMPDDATIVKRFIQDNGLKFVVIEPAYLVMSSMAEASSNDMAMAKGLRAFNEISLQTGCGILLTTHFKKNRAMHVKKFDPPELGDVAHAGYAAWAAYFVLLHPRREWDSEVGQHWQHLVTGGRNVDGNTWALDVFEGKHGDAGGKVWCPAITTASDARRERDAEAERAANDRHQRIIDENVLKVRKALKKFPAGGTKRDVRDKCGLSGTKFGEALDVLDGRGEVLECEVTKGGKSYAAISWKQP